MASEKRRRRDLLINMPSGIIPRGKEEKKSQRKEQAVNP